MGVRGFLYCWPRKPENRQVLTDVIEVLREHSRPVPTWAAQIINQYGKTPWGEPKYRLIWSGDRVDVAGGFFEDTASHEYRLICPYGTLERWCVETWCPPESYGTQPSWDRRHRDAQGFLELGPYPSRGAYETSFVFDQAGVYVEPTPDLLRKVIHLVEAKKLWLKTDKRATIQAEKARLKAQWRQRVSDEYDEAQPLNEISVGYGQRANIRQADDYLIEKTRGDLAQRRRRAALNSFSQL